MRDLTRRRFMEMVAGATAGPFSIRAEERGIPVQGSETRSEVRKVLRTFLASRQPRRRRWVRERWRSGYLLGLYTKCSCLCLADTYVALIHYISPGLGTSKSGPRPFATGVASPATRGLEDYKKVRRWKFSVAQADPVRHPTRNYGSDPADELQGRPQLL